MLVVMRIFFLHVIHASTGIGIFSLFYALTRIIFINFEQIIDIALMCYG